jgi:autotransporter translocation and assembly factor TamB
MHALRGNYWFLSNRFKMDRADLTFDNRQGVDPLLDISATTRVSSVTGDAAGQQETVTAVITGRSSQPVISLTSTNSSSDQRASQSLTVGAGVAGTRGGRHHGRQRTGR